MVKYVFFRLASRKDKLLQFVEVHSLLLSWRCQNCTAI